MADTIYVQDVFSKGELSPTVYARVTAKPYFKGLKTAKNVLPLPQGGARKRFGTIKRAVLDDIAYDQIYSVLFEYLSECVYQIIFSEQEIDIYIEGILVKQIPLLDFYLFSPLITDHTILENKLRITTGNYPPKDLERTPNALNEIISVDGVFNLMRAQDALEPEKIYPARFSNTDGGTLPQTIPPIKSNKTYFVRTFLDNDFAIYQNAIDARDDVNRYQVVLDGFGTNNLIIQNTWTFSDIEFKYRPVFDFEGGYDAITFTPGATTGETTLTASAAIFTEAHVGGLYVGGGGKARIIGYTSDTIVTIEVSDDFNSTDAIKGILSLLSEPAWSDLRGWPRVCSAYQNRAFFANTELLPNGLWGSAINDFEDFDDSELDADRAISWFPTSDIANEIKFISSYKSLIIHTNTGVYSTPMTSETAITPLNFSLTLQDDTPSASIQPAIIDNQVFVLAGSDVHSLIYDYSISGYSSTLVSAVSDHLITEPVDMKSFRDANTAGGRYLFVSNKDGSLAMYQTLMSEEVSGWTPAYMEQSYGNAYFRKILTTVSGRCWFIVEREIGIPSGEFNILGFDPDMNAFHIDIGLEISETRPTALLFRNVSEIETAPQIIENNYYYGIQLQSNYIRVYRSISDAENDRNAISILDVQEGATIQALVLGKNLILEELSYDVKTDCTTVRDYRDIEINSVDDLTLFNAQEMSVKGDGRTYDSNPVINNNLSISIMSQPASVLHVEVGFPINLEIEPMPLSISLGQTIQTSNLAEPKRIKFVNAIFMDTVGGKINKQNIALTKLESISFESPKGKTGIMRVSNMSGWDDFSTIPFKITHNEPYDFTLLGLFYKLEV